MVCCVLQDEVNQINSIFINFFITKIRWNGSGELSLSNWYFLYNCNSLKVPMQWTYLFNRNLLISKIVDVCTSVQQKLSDLLQQKPSDLVQQKPSHLVQQKPSHLLQQKPSHLVQQKPSHLLQQKPSHLVQQKETLSFSSTETLSFSSTETLSFSSTETLSFNSTETLSFSSTETLSFSSTETLSFSSTETLSFQRLLKRRRLQLFHISYHSWNTEVCLICKWSYLWRHIA